MRIVERGIALSTPLDDCVQMAEVVRVVDDEYLDSFPPPIGDKVPLLLAEVDDDKSDSEERSLGDGAEDDSRGGGSDVITHLSGVDPSSISGGRCGGYLNISAVVLLTTINLLNYVDRYTVAGKPYKFKTFISNCCCILHICLVSNE